MPTMTPSRNVSWQPIEQVFSGRKPKLCSFPGCICAPTNVRTVTNETRTRRFSYCDEHLYV